MRMRGTFLLAPIILAGYSGVIGASTAATPASILELPRSIASIATHVAAARVITMIRTLTGAYLPAITVARREVLAAHTR